MIYITMKSLIFHQMYNNQFNLNYQPQYIES